jgi:hypothetical protein
MSSTSLEPISLTRFNLLLTIADPTQLISNESPDTIESDGPERFGLYFGKFGEVNGARIQEQSASVEDLQALLFGEGIEKSYPEEEGTVVARVLFSENG